MDLSLLSFAVCQNGAFICWVLDLILGPLNPAEFRTVTQTETSITLKWRKSNGLSSYVLNYNGTNASVSASAGDAVIQVISNLTSMTRYSFTLFAVFDNISSSGVEHTALTGTTLSLTTIFVLTVIGHKTNKNNCKQIKLNNDTLGISAINFHPSVCSFINLLQLHQM